MFSLCCHCIFRASSSKIEPSAVIDNVGQQSPPALNGGPEQGVVLENANHKQNISSAIGLGAINDGADVGDAFDTQVASSKGDYSHAPIFIIFRGNKNNALDRDNFITELIHEFNAGKSARSSGAGVGVEVADASSIPELHGDSQRAAEVVERPAEITRRVDNGILNIFKP